MDPLFFFDALYCEERHFDEELESEAEAEASEEIEIKSIVKLSEQDSWEIEELTSLLRKEQGIEPQGGYEGSPSLAKARGEAVDWMLKVVGYYSFSALTAVLAVNYLDRFLSAFNSDGEKPWMTQLSAVACLSLAAKVEETHVPLLLDLQVEESLYVFESKTIQRMEILVLSTLKWKMNPVTPLSFLDYIARRLGLKGYICREFLRRSDRLLLSLLPDCRFMSYLPSALATATMLYVISSLEPSSSVEYQDQLFSILGSNKEKVEECCRVIEELGTSAEMYKRKMGSEFPGSPKGVVEVCFSSENSNESWGVGSVSSSPEPQWKRIKCQ